MIWTAKSKNCLATEGGYLITRFNLEQVLAFVARSPGHKILFSGPDLDKAKSACAEHLGAKDRETVGPSS